jgi:hypothetical protein
LISHALYSHWSMHDNSHDLGACICRRGLNWWMDLLTTCIHHSELHFTDHWHSQASVLSLLQSPLAVSWQRLLPREILQLPRLRSSCHRCPCRTNSTNSFPSWRPFHTNALVFSSQADFQLTTELSHSSDSYYTSLHSNELLTTPAAWLVSSLHNRWADPTENIASSYPSVVVTGGCLAIYWILFRRERVYRPLLRNGCFFIHLLHGNCCTRCPFRGLCPATSLYATI